jgi:hypothetical protein
MRLDARLAGQWTPGELGVHPVAGGGPLPAYIRRPHDERLRVILAPPVAGSRLVVVRGEPGAGTTRAAWEAVADVLAEWPLEYPRTAAALAARLEAGIPAGTVLWLGELGRYADADDGAAALNRLGDLLDEDGYLVVTTIWPWQWDTYSAAVGAGRGAGDPAWLAGRMLARLDELSFNPPSSISPDYGGGFLDVPARFTAAELAEAAGSGDPALAAAAAAAGPDGQVTQYLAGIPGLLHRYAGPGGDPRGRAILTAAMDATRLGHTGPLPASLLEQASLLGQAAAGSLPGTPAAAGRESGLAAVPAGEGAGYRLAGALDQYGRRARQDQAGTAALWHALIAHAAGAGTGAGTGLLDTTRLGQAARDRGLYRYAAALWTAAASRGSADAAARLVSLLHETGHEDAERAAGWAAGLVRLDDPWEAARLLDAMRAAGTGDAIAALVARDLAGQADLGARWDALRLLIALGAAGAGDAADALGARLAGRARLDDVPYLAALLRALGTARADRAVRALVARDPARHADPDDPPETALLVTAMHAAGPEAGDATRALAGWAAGHCAIDGPQAVASLLRALRAAGQDGAVRRLLDRDPVGQGRFGDPWEAAALLAGLRAAGEDGAVRRLLDRDPARLGEVDSADSVAWLLTELREAGAHGAIRTLLARDPASHVDLYDPQAIAWLVAELQLAGDVQAIRTLATRVADRGGLDRLADLAEWLEQFRAGGDEGLRILLPADRVRRTALGPPGDIAWLLEHLAAAGAGDLARALLDRDPGGQSGLDDLRDVARLIAALRAAGDAGAARALAARAATDAPRASLADPGGTAALLSVLRAAGQDEAAQALLRRDPARQARLDQPQDVARLIAALRAAGSAAAAAILARRAAGAGMFGVFLAYHSTGTDAGGAVSYRYGCEPDLTPAPPWRWAPPEQSGGLGWAPPSGARHLDQRAVGVGRGVAGQVEADADQFVGLPDGGQLLVAGEPARLPRDIGRERAGHYRVGPHLRGVGVHQPLGKLIHPCLGHAIDKLMSARAQRTDRAYVDDRAAVTLVHASADDRRQPERTASVQAMDLVVVRLGDRREVGIQRRRARVVHQDVDAPRRRVGFADEAVAVLPHADVGGDRPRPAAGGLADLPGERLTSSELAAGDDHVRPGRRVGAHDGGADPPAAAGHERDPPGQVEQVGRAQRLVDHGEIIRSDVTSTKGCR